MERDDVPWDWVKGKARHLSGLQRALVSAGVAVLLLTPPAWACQYCEQAQAPHLAPRQLLDRGEVVVNLINRHPVYHVDVYGLIDGSVDDVWAAITTYDRYEDFLPLVTESSLRQRVGNLVHQYVKIRPPWPLQEHWMLNANLEKRKEGLLRFNMTDGNLRSEHGFWHLTPWSEHQTRLHYHVSLDPWLDFVPGWVIEFGTKVVMPDIVKGVRRRVKNRQ